MRMMRSMRAWLLAGIVLTMSVAASAQVRITVAFGPPALPIYEQPICPGDGYIWTPGYWAWDGDDYYWVPGTWVLAPEIGFFWTPPWWGWDGGVFLFHEGFWGPQIGFYGGINYGFGYFGDGFVGGRWEGGHFFYNRSVTNINVVNIRNVYNERVVVRNESHVSFNGGEGGIQARATAREEAAARERHMAPVAAQMQHMEAARGDREFRASANHGKPPVAATDRPGQFRGSSVVAAREAGGEYRAPANRGGEARGNPEPHTNYVHPHDLPAMDRPTAPNTGNAKLDQKYQKQQQKLMDQQNKEREKLQKQQDKEHAQMSRQQANEARQQQMEQRHQQQTQQMQQRHQTQVQNLQGRQGGGRPQGGGKPQR